PRRAATLFPYTTLFRSAVCDQVGPAFEIPMTPRRDDLYIRLQGVIRQLEPHLVVAFAGRSVGDRIGAFASCDLDLAFCDDGPSKDRKSTRLNSSHVKIS